MDDDLGDSDPASLGYGGKAVPDVYRVAGAIWPAAGSQVNVFVYSDAPMQVDLQVLLDGSGPVLLQNGTSSPSVPLTASFKVVLEGRHVLKAKLSLAGAVPGRLYIKADYLGPATSILF
jgi:hypothetical protein